MHDNAHLVQPRERARANAAHNDRIDLLVVESFHRIARSMRVVLVLVVDRCKGIRVRIDNHEYRSRAEMVVHGTLYPLVLLYWKTNLHFLFLPGFEFVRRLLKYDGAAFAERSRSLLSGNSKDPLDGTS